MKRITKNRNHLRLVRHDRVRAKVKGTAEIPRLSVFRGNKTIAVQLVEDGKGITLCSAQSGEIEKNTVPADKTTKVALAYVVGKKIAERALAKGVKKVVFDRGGYRYHGRVKAVADGARDGGLLF